MALFNALNFTFPFVLIALVTLPALWLILRVTPPSPARIPFPPLILIRQLMREDSAPLRTPLIILILRMLIMASIIIAMSGPSYGPQQTASVPSGPLALFIETGWPIAPIWEKRNSVIEALIADAEKAGRNVILMSTSDAPAALSLLTPSAARERLRTLRPLSYLPNRQVALTQMSTALNAYPDAELVIASDGLTHDHDENAWEALGTALHPRKARMITSETNQLITLAGVKNSAEGLTLRILRTSAQVARDGRIIARDAKGRSLGEAEFLFKADAAETQSLIKLPTDLRNEITRVEIAGTATSGGVALIDDSHRRRRVGIVSAASNEASQPLLSPDNYVARAIEPHADLRLTGLGVAETISTLIDEKIAILILADIGALPAEIETKMRNYVDQGGMIIRFSGPRLAGAADTFLPVRLRGSGRALQGALSWQTPQHLAPFERSSPFFGLAVPDDVTVARQLLAEPDSELTKKTWAALTDGTPIVTAERTGKGLIILFHVTADTSWSSLPLSGLFLSMLERLTRLSTSEDHEAATADTATPLPPLRILDGFGQSGPPMANAKPIAKSARALASEDHPAGLYGNEATPFAVNSLDSNSKLKPLDLTGIADTTIALDDAVRTDLVPLFLILAAILFALDGIIALIHARGRNALSRLSGGIFICAVTFFIHPFDAVQAKSAPTAKEIQAALQTRLAYVLTGDQEIDEISRAGLESLSRILNERTSFEPADPVGVDLKTDDLAVYPLLYWPITADQRVPPQDAIRRIDRFMKNGGTLLFDTRDAALTREGEITPETQTLRMILAGLSVPPLEPLPSNHVLTKAFYLIDRIVGRSANGETWIEAVPKANDDGESPVRAGDGVSPIIITSNDLAAAWATDDRGSVLLPIDAAMPRQREMALRGGVNLVMYVLTGNYKADQVHVPALLERLGK